MSSVTTQLDSLSMATDDSDSSRPTVSKFPKTRPSELSSKQGENGQKIALVSNYIKILAAPKCKFSILFFLFSIIFIFLGDLYRYHCSFEPDVKFNFDFMKKKKIYIYIIDRIT